MRFWYVIVNIEKIQTFNEFFNRLLAHKYYIQPALAFQHGFRRIKIVLRYIKPVLIFFLCVRPHHPQNTFSLYVKCQQKSRTKKLENRMAITIPRPGLFSVISALYRGKKVCRM